MRSGTATAGLGLALAGLVAWAMAIGLQPALTAAGFEAMRLGDLPTTISSGTQLVLLLDAHDLRLAALLVVMLGATLAVVGTPPLAARPAPALLAVGAVLLFANLVWGLIGVGPAAIAPMVLSAAAAALLAGRTAAWRFPATGTEIHTNRTLRLVPALFAAGACFALVQQAALLPELRPFVPGAYLDLLTAVQVLLVVGAVAGALTVGRRWFTPRLVAGIALAATVIAVGAPAAGVLGAGVLALAWTGERGGRPGLRALGAAVAAAVPVIAAPAVITLGVVLGIFSLLLSFATLGADGMPMIGSAVLLGALYVAVDAACPVRREVLA